MTGTGGGGTTTAFSNYGVSLSYSTVVAGGMGTVTVVGQGGHSSGAGGGHHGVNMGGKTLVTSGGGDVSVTGTGGDGVGPRAVITAGGTETIRVTGIGIRTGSGNTPTQLSLAGGGLSKLTAGTLNLGDGTTGPITVDSSVTFTQAPGVQLNLITAPGKGVSPSANGTDLNLNGGSLSISTGSNPVVNLGGTAADTGYQRLVAGGTAQLSGVNLVLTGGYTS